MSGPWGAWSLDGPTWAWIVWLAYFGTLEGWAVVSRSPVHTLTYHLRPFFLAAPVIWWVAFGLWLWLGVHMLAPSLERDFMEWVRL